MSATFYDLDGNPTSLESFVEMMDGDGRLRIVKQSKIGRFFVSTVFLGLDHNFRGDGPPLIFETMVFERRESKLCWRYSSRADALAGHAAAVRAVRWRRWWPFGPWPVNPIIGGKAVGATG